MSRYDALWHPSGLDDDPHPFDFDRRTDLRKLTDLLDEFGVEYEDDPKSEGYPNDEWGRPLNEEQLVTYGRRIQIGTDGEKHIGYGGFVAHFYFDDDERFVKVGVWE